MKTSMQEVFAHLRASKESDSFGEAYCVDWLLQMEESMLEKEKDMAKEAWDKRIRDEYIVPASQLDQKEFWDMWNDRFENWYNEKYGTE